MPGLLASKPAPGLLERPFVRQVTAPGMAPQGAGWMAAGGAMDPRDIPGSGVSIWRELMRGMSKNGIAALAPNAKTFSPENRALLAPMYQQKGRK
jgi:hypothetical protein